MESAIKRRKSAEHKRMGSVVKKAILPTFYFAALSTVTFEEAVYAAQTNPTQATIVSQGTTKYVNIASGWLNLRSAASTNAAIIAKLPKGTAVTVTAEANDWSEVKVNGQAGYVSASFLSAVNPNGSAVVGTTTASTVTQASPTTKYVNITSGWLNMRNGTSTSASIIVKLTKGTAVVVESELGGWAKIEAYGQTGYVSSQFLTAELPGTTSAALPVQQQSVSKYVNVSDGSSLNLRTAPSTSATILARLLNGTQVSASSDENGWAKVQVNGQTGYVSSSYLSDTVPGTNSSPKQTTVTKYVNVDLGSSLNMRKSPATTSSIIVKLARGVAVTVYTQANGWAEISVYGQTGYVSTSFLTDAKPGTGTDTTADSSNQAQTAPANPSGTSPDQADNAAVTKYVNVIYGSSLNLRSAASTNAAILTRLTRGTVVTVISEENGWAQVTGNGVTGYVSSQYLSTTIPLNPASINNAPMITYENYSVSLADMEKIQLTADPQTDKKYNTYIREDALTLTNPTAGTVNGGVWNIRGGAGTNYWVVGTVSSSAHLQILATVKGTDGYDWYQVNDDQTWVNASPDDVAYYLDPNNFINSPVDSMQFLKLSVSADLDATEVNTRILAGKGSLQGMASAFITAGTTYGVNEIYLISHALLETGNGTSQLANGVQINGKTVYNMYGIGAYDDSPVTSGAQFAYNSGWFTPEAAIIGGAQFIANGYIHSGQDTLYKMRWNPDAAAATGVPTHQYATDIGWAEKQVEQIYNLYQLLDSYKIVLDIPKYQ